jgi:WD repeat-containing protein 60
MEDPNASSPAPTTTKSSSSGTRGDYGSKSSASSSTSSKLRFPRGASKMSSSASSSSSRSRPRQAMRGFSLVSSTASDGQNDQPSVRGPNPRRARRVALHRSKVGVMESVSTRILDLAPLGKMDMYVRRLGARSIKQVAQSTADDVRSMDVQTDEISYAVASAQVPDDLGYGSSSSSSVSGPSSSSSSSAAAAAASPNLSAATLARQAMGLTNFLRLSATVVETIVAENRQQARNRQGSAAGSKERDASSARQDAFSWLGGSRSGHIEYLDGRPVIAAATAVPSKTAGAHTVVTVHGPKGGASGVANGGGGGSSFGDAGEKSSAASPGGSARVKIERKASSFIGSLASKSIICVWGLSMHKSNDVPLKSLICEGVPRCCALSPGRGNIVLAGTEEGTIALWDLSESAAMHHQSSGGDALTFNVRGGLRRPTYTTDALTLRGGAASVSVDSRGDDGVGGQHSTPVVSINIMQELGGGSRSADAGAEEMGGGASNSLSFQLATLEEAGVVMLWTVLRLRRGDQAGSETDLGLGIGGRVKLIRSARIPVLDSVAESVTAMRFCPSDTSRFYVSTVSGRLIHASRFRTAVSPRAFVSGSSRAASSVMCIATTAHAAFSEYILCGRSDGSLSMFRADAAQEVAFWDDMSTGAGDMAAGGSHDAGAGSSNGSTGGGATKWSSVPCSITKIVWSTVRPSLFWVLDSGGRMHSWDLLQNPFGAVRVVGGSEETHNVRDGRIVDIVLREANGLSAWLVALHESGRMAVMERANEKMDKDEEQRLVAAFDDLAGILMVW